MTRDRAPTRAARRLLALVARRPPTHRARPAARVPRRRAERQGDVRADRRRQGRAHDAAVDRHVRVPRPGKFRWTYEKPYEQLIVGDGEQAVDLRRGPEPGDRAQARRGARRDAGGAARRQQRRSSRTFTLARRAAAATGSTGSRRRRETQRIGVRAHPHRLRRQPACDAMELHRQLRPDARCSRSPTSSAIRSSHADAVPVRPPKGADVVGD